MEKFEISLVSISEKEFYLSPKDNLNINEKYLNLGFGFQFKGKDNSDFIEMVVSIVYLYKTAKVEKELLKFKTAFEFEVSNLEIFIESIIQTVTRNTEYINMMIKIILSLILIMN